MPSPFSLSRSPLPSGVSGGIIPAFTDAPEETPPATLTPASAPVVTVAPASKEPVSPAPSPTAAPQTTATLAAAGDEASEQRHALAMDKWGRTTRDHLRAAFLNWDGFAKKHGIDFSGSPDPEAEKRDFLIDCYLQGFYGEGATPVNPLLRKLRRDQVAQVRFNNRGAGDDQAFLEEARREAVNRNLLQAKPNVTLADDMTRRMTEGKIFPSVTSALANAWDKNIYRNPDGTWDLPILTQQSDYGVIRMADGASYLLAQKAGSRLKHAGSRVDKEAIQQIFYKFQTDHNLSDDEVRATWSDLGNLYRPFEPEEAVRTLHDGTLVPNVMNSDWLDEAKAKAIIQGSNGTPATKAAMQLNLPRIQQAIARKKFAAYEAAATAADSADHLSLTGTILSSNGGKLLSPSDWARTRGLPDSAVLDDMKRMIEYENDQIHGSNSVRNWFNDVRVNGAVGFMQIGADLAGLGGAMGWDAAGEFGRDSVEPLAQATEGRPDANFITGTLPRNAAPIFFQILVTRGAGLAAEGVAGAAGLAEGSAAALRVAQSARNLAAIVQPALMTVGNTYNARLAAGDSEEDARRYAFAAGTNAAIITSLFGTGKWGGIESVAAGRLEQVTVGDLLKIATREGVKDLATSPELRRFATGILQQGLGQATEQGVTTLTQTLLTADPTTDLSHAWDQSLQAAAEAMGTTLVTHAVVGATETKRRDTVPEPDQPNPPENPSPKPPPLPDQPLLPPEPIQPPDVLAPKPPSFAANVPETRQAWEAAASDIRDKLFEDFKANGPVNLSEGAVTFDNHTGFRQNKGLSLTDFPFQYEATERLRELLENSVPVKSEPLAKNGVQTLHHRYAWMTFADGTTRPVALTLGEWQPELKKPVQNVRALEVGPAMDIAGKDPAEAFLSSIKQEHHPDGEDAESVWTQKVPAITQKTADSGSYEPDYAKAKAQGIAQDTLEALMMKSREVAAETLKAQPKVRGMGGALFENGTLLAATSRTIAPDRFVKVHPFIINLYKKAAPEHQSRFKLGCAEVSLISIKLWDAGAPTELSDSALQKVRHILKGSTVVAFGIGGNHHSLVRNPCRSCEYFLKELGVNYLESQNHPKNNTDIHE